jgi:hypothetical protein
MRGRSIPIYDDTAPIACTIEREEVPERIELFERLRVDHTRLERTEHGLRLHFPNRSDIEADLRRFAVDEQRCCNFWGFEVETEDGNLALRWDSPPSAAELIERVVAYLEGDEPLTAIAGLL